MKKLIIFILVASLWNTTVWLAVGFIKFDLFWYEVIPDVSESDRFGLLIFEALILTISYLVADHLE